MILTNKCSVEYNFEAILRDFDVYVVTKESAKLDRTNILDNPSGKFKALAVQYTFGRTALVLFSKGEVVESEFREELQTKYTDVTVKKVSLNDLQSQEFETRYLYYQKRMLAQLLINSLRVPKTKDFSYNNLTGKLLYSDYSWKHMNPKTGEILGLWFLEVLFEPGMFLDLKVKTFRKSNFKTNKREYLFDADNGKFRKKLFQDSDQQPVYVEMGYPNKRKTVDYLDISSFEKFQKCKLGVMQRFFMDVERSLSDYMKISFGKVEKSENFKITKKVKEEVTLKEMGDLLNARGVRIIDENHTEQSAIMCERFRKELSDYYGVSAIVGSLEKDKYNIRIIHEADYYEKREMNDPHEENLGAYIVQHAVEEEEHFNRKDKISPAVEKIVQELIMKGDVQDCRLSMFDWKELNTEKKWTFVIRDKIKNSVDGKSEAHLDSQGKTSYNWFSYSVLTIDLDGDLVFESFTDEEFPENEMQEKIIFAYDFFTNKSRGSGDSVEGLVYSDIDEIQAIILTREKTMPDIRGIWNGLSETEDRAFVDKEVLLEAIHAFLEEYPEYELYCQGLLEIFCEADKMIVRKEIREKMNMRCTAAQLLNRYLHKNFGIRIAHEIKNQDMEEEYQISNVLDIKYYQKEDYEGIPTFYYYVGTKRKNLKFSIHNACSIRKVVSMEGKPDFESLLPLMSVEFVRNKQYTVLPFPFKYLREKKNMQKSDNG